MNAATTTYPSTQTDSLLRLALRLDATLTGLAGLAIAAFAGPVASLTGLTPTHAYIFGAAFVAYGVVVYRLGGVEKVRAAGRWVIVANLLYALGSVIVVVDGLLALTTAGNAAMLAGGAYTVLFAALQYLGLRRLA